MNLYREYWHRHDAAFMKKRGPINFAQRFYEAFGFAHDAIYPQWNIDKDYSHSWVVLEDQAGYAEKYASVFDHYNIYTTLNYYPEEYARARERFQAAEHHHKRFLRMNPSPSEFTIKERERELAALEAAIPKSCFVDMAFDFDVGKEIKSLDEASLLTLKLIQFFEKKNVPYQLFFTGGRGFHVVVNYRCFEQPLDENNHLVNKCMAHMIQKETGGLLNDEAIYSWRRQFRLPNTVHNKTGLYKIFITREDLEHGIEHIQSLATIPRDVPVADASANEYLCRLYGLAKAEVDKQKRYEVKKQDVRELQAARQSASSPSSAPITIKGLHHPPCIREALSVGIKDGAPANRNLITVFLATYFKAIGRSRDEATALLTDHAIRVLARFSGSGVKEIESSTKGAVATVYRYAKYSFNCAKARKYLFTCNDTCELFKKYRESVFNRRLQISGKKELTGANIYDTPESIREAITERIKGYLDKCDRDPDHCQKALLVKAPSGAGKTTITFDYFAKHRRDRVCWVASQHALYDNIPDRLKSRWLRIEGRHPDTYDKDGNLISEATCFHFEDAKRLRDKRLNVNRLLCSNCEDRYSCWYLAQFKDKRSNWFIQQPTFLFKAEDFVSKFDTVVFDEDILANFVEEIVVTADDVRLLLAYVDALIEDMEAFGTDGVDGYKNLRRILETLETFLAGKPPRKEISGDIFHRRLDEVCRELHDQPIRDLLGAIGRDQYEIIDRIHFDIYEDDLPLNFAESFLRLLHFELFEKEPGSNLSRFQVRSRKMKRASPTRGKPNRESVLRMVSKIPMPPINKPIITLDATGRKDIYTRLFERDIDVFDASYRYRNKVIQVYSSASTITALQNKRHLERMLEGLKHYLEKEPRSLVIAKKALEPIIRPLLPPEAAFTWFFGNRGSNEFMGYKQVIVFGAPGFDMETVLMYASCLYYDRNLSTDCGLEPRTYTGTSSAINVFRFKEQLIQNILEVSREDESYQSLNRGRLVLDPAITLILMTNIVIEQLPVSELISMDDLIGRRPDSGAEAHRDTVRDLMKKQLAAIGFVSVAKTLRPFLESGHSPPRAVSRYFSDRSAVIRIPSASRMNRRTVERHVQEISDEMSLVSFRMFYRTPRCNGYFDILGQDDGCTKSAESFFSGFPGFEKATFKFKRNVSETHKKADE